MINLFSKIDIEEVYENRKYIPLEIENKSIYKKREELVIFIDANENKYFVGIYKQEGVIKVISKIISMDESSYNDIKIKLKDKNVIQYIELENLLINPEVKIDDISTLISITSLLNNKVIFRGQSNKEWEITPSIFRNGWDIENEKELYKDIQQWNHDKFSSKDFIENICNMQHYGIPTRFIDWTTNPLYALYFAISSKTYKDSDGKIFCIECKNIHDSESDVYNELKEFLSHRYKSCNSLDKNKNDNEAILTRAIREKSRHVFIKTKYYNDRIRNQQGIFSTYIDMKSNEAESIIVKAIEDITQNILRLLKRDIKNYTIDTTLDNGLKRILRNERSQDIAVEKIKKLIKIKYRLNNTDKYQQNIENIINMHFLYEIYEIYEIEYNINTELSKQFQVSIIIPAQYKELLLNQLDRLGVNGRNIYPDIEGLAIYMREKYQ